jgi:hypothetical protein
VFQGAPGGAAEVMHLSWNRKVQHILASCLSNGTTVVWDLKRQKPVISFRDVNRRDACTTAWNENWGVLCSGAASEWWCIRGQVCWG